MLKKTDTTDTHKVNYSESKTSGKTTFQRSKSLLIAPDCEIKIEQSNVLEDIDGREGIFIVAEFKNTSKKNVIPSVLWNTYLRFTEKEDETNLLYKASLSLENSDKDDYVVPIINMSSEVKPDESKQIGIFYSLPEKKKVSLIVCNETGEEFYSEAFPYKKKSLEH